MAAAYREMSARIDQAGRMIAGAADLLAGYLASVESGVPAVAGAVRVDPVGTLPTSPGDGDEDPRVEAARNRLPRPVTRGRGQKTRGEWFTPEGDSATIASGTDARSVRVDAVLREKNCPLYPLTVVADAELKLAVHMRDNEIKRATLVLNNFPCPGPYGCDELISVVLPPGYVLTVYGPDGFKKRYLGGAKPW
ncbi:DddA-like double-stranded DNA deaminase toxin [Actinokineospora pegani]|uniref:DddA-like double-stranded DNA deaminase toxin n=1 Tax=Actinokineospora pegani TaxID=2654637 RepID=UPI0012EAB33C|nr:DddA-like double-stranded DNA deaminase toxin [Actinokineospora pegani]